MVAHPPIPLADLDKLDKTQLILPANHSSWVWLHFRVFTDPAKDGMTVCLHCGHVKEHSGNTSNMSKHLSEVHKIRDIREFEQTSSVQTTLSWPKATTATKTRLNKALAMFIAGDGRPLNLIKGKWFVAFVKVSRA